MEYSTPNQKGIYIMPNVKKVNYTDEQVSEMRVAYDEADTFESREEVVQKIAEKFKKSKRSIIAKMSREGFYIKKEVVSKVTGAKPAKKEDLAIELRKVSLLPLVSAEKLTKTDILDLINFFNLYNIEQGGEELSELKES